MFKALSNFFLVVLICLTAIGISVNSSPLVNDFDPTINTSNNEEISLVTDVGQDTLSNPSDIQIIHKTSNSTSLTFNSDYIFTGKIYKDGELYKLNNWIKITESNPFTFEISNNNPYSTTIDISQQNLNLPNGKYEIHVMSNADEYSHADSLIKLNVEYFSNVNYIKAKNNTPSQKTGITLYFSNKDNNLEQLVGVTRFINKTNSLLYTALNELQSGPNANTELNSNPPIGKYNYITTKKNVTYIDLPSTESKYTTKPYSKIAMTSLYKTIGNINGVKRIKFLVDYNRADTFFNGIDIKKYYIPSFNNKAYLGFNTGNRYYLVDYDIKSIKVSDSIDTKVTKIISVLKNNNLTNLCNTVPQNINIIDSSVTHSTLTLNFNNEFLKSFNNNINLQQMMIDSILYSFTSIDNIEYIQILIDGNKIDKFAGFNLSNPLTRPLYINPEE